MLPGYENTLSELEKRILKLIPANTQILEITDVWDLFKIDGFKCDDIEPSYAQARHALNNAIFVYKESLKCQK